MIFVALDLTLFLFDCEEWDKAQPIVENSIREAEEAGMSLDVRRIQTLYLVRYLLQKGKSARAQGLLETISRNEYQILMAGASMFDGTCIAHATDPVWASIVPEEEITKDNDWLWGKNEESYEIRMDIMILMGMIHPHIIMVSDPDDFNSGATASTWR
ncbi:MAG: hypothetical protein M1820_009566 [Bogoriella megaspora]|nr:MAG: hypothetical protein M1820_009566 [Bogoriella megaspora]